MIYTELTKKAFNIALNAHAGQFDKAGVPYIFHPFHVAEQMDDEYSTCVALLHDVIEDSSVTLNELKDFGFPTEIVGAIEMLTHKDGVSYMDYIHEIKNNKLAAYVKLYDLKHNSQLERFNKITEKDFKRAEKYKEAIEILETNLQV